MGWDCAQPRHWLACIAPRGSYSRHAAAVWHVMVKVWVISCLRCATAPQAL